MSLFGNNQKNDTQTSQRQLLQDKYASSCNNILLVVALSLVNIILLVTNSNTYFLFSAYIPYLLADLGMLFCGMYPQEIYAQDFLDMEFLPKEFLIITLCVAAVILILYFLSWIFSKKQKSGWLVFALVFFVIDTVVMFFLNGFIIDSVIDYIIHIWVIVSLASGLVTLSKLKKLPEEQPTENGSSESEDNPDKTEE